MTLADILSIEPFTWTAIGTAILAGLIVGLERQLRGKPVGIRTSSLICLGTYIFVAVSAQLNNSTAADPTRIIGQVITGIGFLGGGVILTKEGIVLGVTSAATIWTLAAIGCCIGIGNHASGIKLAVISVLILTLVDVLEDYFHSLRRGVHQKIKDWTTKPDSNQS